MDGLPPDELHCRSYCYRDVRLDGVGNVNEQRRLGMFGESVWRLGYD